MIPAIDDSGDRCHGESMTGRAMTGVPVDSQAGYVPGLARLDVVDFELEMEKAVTLVML